MYEEDDAISAAISSRRIPHGRSRHNGKGSKSSGQSSFNPLKAMGEYEIKVSTSSKSNIEEFEPSRLTIHGFTNGEEGLVATLIVGDVLESMAILAGSRKGMKVIIDELEEQEKDEQDEEVEEIETVNEDKDEDSRNNTESEDGRTAIELADDRINRRAKAFEKNSFRNPKFFMCWNGKIRTGNAATTFEKNMGYIVFSGNDCSTFEGTISSQELEWDNVKMKGKKSKSGSVECSLKWTDFA